jgi:hypothetical protein
MSHESSLELANQIIQMASTRKDSEPVDTDTTQALWEHAEGSMYTEHSFKRACCASRESR